MRTQEGRRAISTKVVLWAIEIAILVALLLIIGFLEGLEFFKPVFTPPGAFFIRIFVVVGWALASFYFNDNRARSS